MAKTNSTATWQTIDVATLDIRAQEKYNEYKNQYQQMKEARIAFEDCVRDMIPTASNKRLVFGYNFGKLSVAVVDATATPKPVAGSLSLSQFIAAQQAQGKRT